MRKCTTFHYTRRSQSVITKSNHNKRNKENIMGAYQSLHDDITNYLRLTSTVVATVGQNIDVGERFTLRIIATNVSTDQYMVFRSVRIHVVGGMFANPVNGDFHGHPPKADLSPGESSSVDIEFLA